MATKALKLTTSETEPRQDGAVLFILAGGGGSAAMTLAVPLDVTGSQADNRLQEQIIS